MIKKNGKEYDWKLNPFEFVCNPENDDKKNKTAKWQNLGKNILMHYKRQETGKWYTKHTHQKDNIEKTVLYIILFAKEAPKEFIILQHIS